MLALVPILCPGTPNITGPSSFSVSHLPTQLGVERDYQSSLGPEPPAPSPLATYFCW